MNFFEWEELFGLEGAELWTRMAEASRVREQRCGRQVSFCVIIMPSDVLRGLRLLPIASCSQVPNYLCSTENRHAVFAGCGGRTRW
jgi:hypothetical protein